MQHYTFFLLKDIKVDDHFYWGAGTQRSLENFKIGNQKMPSDSMLGNFKDIHIWIHLKRME